MSLLFEMQKTNQTPHSKQGIRALIVVYMSLLYFEISNRLDDLEFETIKYLNNLL